MQVSDKLLRRFVDLDGLNPEDIKNILCEGGIEVTGYRPLAQGDKLVIAKILEVHPVEGSNHLHYLKVDEGNKLGTFDVVCGAPNVRVGLNTVVARVGCSLKDGKINEAKIMGLKSFGMCCSYKELGIEHKYLTDEENAGIIELDEDAPIGEEEVLKYLCLDDFIYDIELLPSRSYCLSIINLAKELAALANRKIKDLKIDDLTNFKTDFVVSSDTDKCPQFAIRVVNGVKVKPSPRELRFALLASGYRSINNIVDIGNYVMLLTGQPLHMYDLDKLHSHALIARDDIEEDFVALDDNHYEVKKGDICITNDGKTMCLGGIMGAKCCAVDGKTQNIAIESASFYHASIRHTSRRLGLASESSTRFIKGTNHFQSQFVLDLVASLVQKLANANKISNIVSYTTEEDKLATIDTTISYINNRLATNLRLEEIVDILERESLGVETEGEKLHIKVPHYRLDLKEPCDISEEIIRFVGFSRVKEEEFKGPERVGGVSLEEKKINDIRNLLLGRGLDECITYSLVDAKKKDSWSYLNDWQPVKLLHPLTDKHEYIRTNVLPSLLESASYNYTHQNKDLALFEVSDVYLDENTKETRLAVVLVGKEELQSKMDVRPYSYFTVKGYLEAILDLLHIDSSRYQIERLVSDKKEFHPGRSAAIKLNKRLVGVLGEMYPRLRKDYDFGKENIAVMELNLSAILEVMTSPVTFKEINKFPVVKRDLALLVKDDVTYQMIKKVIKTSGHQIILDVEPFDLYVGEGVANGYHSLAITITYGDNKKTLVDEEVNRVENDIKYALRKELGIELRG